MERDYTKMNSAERLKIAESYFENFKLNEALDCFLESDKIKNLIDSGYKKYESEFFKQTQELAQTAQKANFSMYQIHIAKNAFIDYLRIIFKLHYVPIIDKFKDASKSDEFISFSIKFLLSPLPNSFMIEMTQIFIDDAINAQLYANRAMAIFDLVVDQINPKKD